MDERHEDEPQTVYGEAHMSMEVDPPMPADVDPDSSEADDEEDSEEQ